MLKGYFGLHYSEYLCGFGCFFAYASLVQYLDFSPKYSIIFKTLTHAVPIIIRTSVGIIPIFMGAVLLAVSLFSASNRFKSASMTAINLYAMINGDELQDIFRDLTGIQLLTSLIFCYLYIFFGYA